MKQVVRQPNTPSAPPRMTRELLTTQLSDLLSELSAAYESLLVLSDDHRAALRRADGRAVELAAAGQQSILETVGALEQRRRELVARAAPALPELATKKATQLTLTDLARAAHPDSRPRLLERAAALRTIVSQYHDKSGTILAATRSLMDHATGLVHQVSRHLSHAGTYSRRGVVVAVPGVVSAVDIRS